jgi:hypothetical protein
MATKLIAMILGVALVLATATVYTQSAFAIHEQFVNTLGAAGVNGGHTTITFQGGGPHTTIGGNGGAAGVLGVIGGNGGVGFNLLPFIEKFVNQPGIAAVINGAGGTGGTGGNGGFIFGQTAHEISALRAGIHSDIAALRANLGHLGVNIGDFGNGGAGGTGGNGGVGDFLNGKDKRLLTDNGATGGTGGVGDFEVFVLESHANGHNNLGLSPGFGGWQR